MDFWKIFLSLDDDIEESSWGKYESNRFVKNDLYGWKIFDVFHSVITEICEHLDLFYDERLNEVSTSG